MAKTNSCVPAVVNNTLRTLDVSWNHLRLRGAMSFCQGIAVSDSGLCWWKSLAKDEVLL